MMRKIIISIAVLIFLLAMKAYAYDDHDFQVWNTDIEEFNIGKDLKLITEQEFRWADNAREFNYQHYDIGLFYGLNKNWSVGGGYRQVYELSGGKFKEENEPYVTATLTLTGGGFTFESRNRIEYRHFAYNKADSGRYRNKFTLKLPFKFTKIQIQPFIGDEVMFSIGGTNQFSQNRFSAGLGTTLTKNVKAEIYYMLVSVKSAGRWVDSNVLGTKLKLVF